MRYFFLILSTIAMISYVFTSDNVYLVKSCIFALFAIFLVLDKIYDKLKEKYQSKNPTEF